jgi:hypothetical protein
MFGENPDAVIPLSRQLAIFHRGRARRIIKWDDGAVDTRTPVGRDFLEAARNGLVDGGNAANFLTSF